MEKRSIIGYLAVFLLRKGQALFLLFLLCLITPRSIVVKATVYQGIISQTDETPNVTATGDKFNPLNPPRWIAVSRDLLEEFPYNSQVEIQGTGIHDGIYKVKDTMHKRKLNQIDILIPSTIEPGDPEYGYWQKVTISKI